MQEKYTNPLKYGVVKAQRAALKRMIGDLVRWSPLESPRAGFSVIIGCNARLRAVARANLMMLSRQRLDGLAEVILVWDRPAEKMPESFTDRLAKEFPDLPLRVLHYSSEQHRRATRINWAWVYAWMSWSIGIGACSTRHAMLHDFDAMLLEPGVLRRRFEIATERGVEYLGVKHYDGNGILLSDELVTTFEMMFDAAFVRSNFKPIDLFNHVTRYNGRTVDFDTFLWAESRAGRTAVVALPEEEMVHPTQMICQFTQLVDADEQPFKQNNLLMIPYFEYVGGDSQRLVALTEAIAALKGGEPTVEFFGKPMSLANLTSVHAAWLRKQAGRMEAATVGAMRPEVEAYFNAIDAWVGFDRGPIEAAAPSQHQPA